MITQRQISKSADLHQIVYLSKSPYFCIDIFSGVRSQKLVQCESEITERPQTGISHVMCNF